MVISQKTFKLNMLICLLVIIGSVSSCNIKLPESKIEDKRQVVFFDLKNYFEAIVEFYEENNIKVNKRVSFGTKTEYKEGLELDWQTEFQTFIDSDINRLAWIDKFEVDTIPAADGFSVLYQNTSPTIPIKQIEVSFSKNEQVKDITIKSQRQSLLYKSKQTLNFKPNVSYSVEGWQRTMMLAKTEFAVKGNIVK